jgi:putative ABC transport system ATP-binding protein
MGASTEAPASHAGQSSAAGPAVPDGGAPVARLRGVERVYRQGSQEVRALNGVDLDVYPGEFVSLAGPSGSGKSTLLNVIGGLDRPTAGTVELGGVALAGMSAAELASLRLHRIGFVFQAYNLIPVLSARENVEFVLHLQGVAPAQRRARALEVLADLGIAALADRRPADMSGGQQQRVAVARALAARPLLLLADEPSANLDSDTTRTLLGLLRTLNERDGVTIVTATHDPIVLGFARRHVRLVDGRIVDDVRDPS